MDYVVGSIAALISGNVTPNRPKLMRRALTPTKHPSSPNVTPKSEYVDDRSIFLSPTLQKKKAVVKRSPKRIFETPDLDTTENNEGSSPKADKVKKHLKDELEAEEMAKSSKVAKISPSNKQNKSVESITLNKKSKIIDLQSEVIGKEHTPKKKNKKSLIIESMDIDETMAVTQKVSISPKKMKQRRKSIVDIDSQEKQESSVAEPNQTVEGATNKNQKKKNKKHKKKNKQASQESKPVENQGDATENTEAKNPKKKKRKNKNKKSKSNAQTVTEVEIPQSKNDSDDDDKTANLSHTNKEVDKLDDEETSEPAQDIDSHDDNQESGSEEEISNIANPNAITEQDTDSEHDSDDEIESENEEINNEVLKTDKEASSDEDDEPKAKKVKSQKENQDGKESQDKEGNTEEEIKRTLFVGNVPFSNKCKKEIKRIFAQYGDIETVRIRTVPVKDARVTPKLAVIKNEIHPDRSTVNVYIKFAEPDSVERALAENNTVLNHHHLRVSRSGSSGLEHEPALAVFVGNLPFGLEDEALRERFQKCGDIHSVRIVRDRKTNAGKGFGYVNFVSKDGVELALELSEEDLTIKNRIIRVKRCTQTLNKAKNAKKTIKPGPVPGGNQGQNRNVGNQSQNGNNQAQNRNFSNQRNFGNRNQGPSRSFGNNQGQSRNFGNNQGQNRNFGNNQGQTRNFGHNQGQNRNFGNQNKFGNQGNEPTGASRRLMNKRPHQDSSDGPPNKKQNVSQPPREKKQRKEFVGMTAEKKKKQKFDKGMKKKKAISEIMTKKT